MPVIRVSRIVRRPAPRPLLVDPRLRHHIPATVRRVAIGDHPTLRGRRNLPRRNRRLRINPTQDRPRRQRDGPSGRRRNRRLKHRRQQLRHSRLGLSLRYLHALKRLLIQLHLRQCARQKILQVLPRREPRIQLRLHQLIRLRKIEAGRWKVRRSRLADRRPDAMVPRQRHPHIRHTAIDILIQPGKKRVQIHVRRIDHRPLLRRIRPDFMSQNICRRDADRQHIRRLVLAQLLSRNQCLRKVQQVRNTRRRRAYIVVKMPWLRMNLFDRLFHPPTLVECLYKLRQLRPPIGRRDKVPAIVVQPESSVRCMSRSQNRRAILQRNPIHLRLPPGRQLHLIAQRRGQLISRRSANILRAVVAHNLVPLVFHRTHRMVGIAAQIPPLVHRNPVARRVRTRPNR